MLVAPVLPETVCGVFKVTGSRTYIWDGEIATCGQDLSLDSLKLTAEDTVFLDSFTITVPN